MNILLIDDDPVLLTQMTALVKRHGVSPMACDNAEEGYELLKGNDEPLIVILDWSMEGMDGPTLCELIRNTDLVMQPYIIMVTGKISEQDRIYALERGADHFLSKPVSPSLLIASIKVGERILNFQQELIESRQKVAEAAMYDPMTEVYNRATGAQLMKQQMSRLARSPEESACIAFIDIDYFKQVNDTHGHDAGDAVIKGFAQRVKAILRDFDILCRWGGDEFIVMGFLKKVDAKEMLERLRFGIASTDFPIGKSSLQVSASIGAITFDGGHRLNLDALIKIADEQVYEAKKLGRNVVCQADLSPQQIEALESAEDADSSNKS